MRIGLFVEYFFRFAQIAGESFNSSLERPLFVILGFIAGAEIICFGTFNLLL